MKTVLSMLVLVLAFSTPIKTARAQTKGPDNGDTDKAVASDHSNKSKPEQSEKRDVPKNSDETLKGEADKASISASSTASAAPTLNPTANDSATSDAPARTTPNVPAATPATTEPPAPKTKANVIAVTPLAPTEMYRVGVGDVLDIHLLNTSSQQSTLYTVMTGGLLEYPLAGEPVQVNGLTADEINALLKERIKVFENPQLSVSVREYASHNVIITGLISNPGARNLRREAVPLYVLLAEEQLRPEAARATILRAGAQSITVDLSDTTATSTLVQPGDVIRISTAPPASPQFYFIGGQINSPGQKDFHAGLTLMQAILASGGVSNSANSKVKVARQGADGRLVTTEYNLKDIGSGKAPDPPLQSGDRIEVGRSHW